MNATLTPNISTSAADEEVYPPSSRTVDSGVSRTTPPRRIAARQCPTKSWTAPVEMLLEFVAQPSRRIAISTRKRCSSVDLARVQLQGLTRSVRLVVVLSRRAPMMSACLINACARTRRRYAATHSQRSASSMQTESTTVLHQAQHQSPASYVLRDALPRMNPTPPTNARSPTAPVRKLEHSVDDLCSRDATSRTNRSTTAQRALVLLQSCRNFASLARPVKKTLKGLHAVDQSAPVPETCRCARTSSQTAVVSRRTPFTSAPRAVVSSWTRIAKAISRAYLLLVEPLVLQPTASALRMDRSVGDSSLNRASSMVRPCTLATPEIVLSWIRIALPDTAMSPCTTRHLLRSNVSILACAPALI